MGSRKDLATLYQQLALAKPVSRAVEKRSRRREASDVIRQVRADVWARSCGRCEVCGRTEAETAASGVLKATHEMHELETRAETRGRPPEERFSLENCIRVCPPCHALFTARQIAMDPTDHRTVLLVPIGVRYQVPVSRAALQAVRLC